MKNFFVTANWKMYKSPREAVEYMKSFIAKAKDISEQKQMIFFVPAIDLWVVEQTVRGTTVGFGAQNCHFENQGAFTGENSPAVLSEIGAKYCLVGHSERRTLFHETDETCAKKVKALQELGLTPMLCVGETLAEREKNQTDEVIRRQLKVGLSQRVADKSFIVAYEPVWAIGTGKVATPEQANDAHAVLREELKALGGDQLANTVSILYGGSVKPDNAQVLANQPEVDGFLVGGASLEVDSFLALCKVDV